MARRSDKPNQKTRTKPSRQRVSKRHKSGGLRALFRNHQEVAVDSLERLLVTPGTSLLTWLVIGIALALPLSLLLVLQNLQQFGSNLDEAGQVSLYMERGLPEESLASIRREIEGRQDVTGTDYISSRQALDEFETQSGFGDVLGGLDENPLPPVIIVDPGANDIGRIQSLVADFEAMDGVDYVQFDLAWLQRLNGILDLAGRLTVMLGALLCVGVALVVGNTVRLAIENRREEIVVVKLVGGTDSYVARPFLYTGLWYGVGGGIIACLLLFFARFGLQGPVSRLAGLYDGSFRLIGLDVSGFLLVLAAGGALGWIGAWLSVVRHLKAIEPR